MGKLILGAPAQTERQVNCELRIHQDFGELRSRRDLAAGRLNSPWLVMFSTGS